MNRAETRFATLILLALSFFFMIRGTSISVHALAASNKVAYVTDFSNGKGCEDPTVLGSSIFTNAILGAPPAGSSAAGCTYTTSGAVTTHFTNVFVSTIDANGVAALSGYDTVLVYLVCDIGGHSGLVSALNSYLSAGSGKVVIYDADYCADGNLSSGGPTPNYNAFLFPFTGLYPGPNNYVGSITRLEAEIAPATLTSGLAVGDSGGFPGATDAIGDSNTFTPYGSGWCAAIEGTALSAPGPFSPIVTGVQVAYARTFASGLVIYDGNDNWFTDFENGDSNGGKYDKQVFDNILDQPFNPDSLPCNTPITGINLAGPTSATSSYTLRATLTQSNGSPAPGITVTFAVTSGPDKGIKGTVVTGANGQATFMVNPPFGGTDTDVATYTDSSGALFTSNIRLVSLTIGGSNIGGIVVPVSKLALLSSYLGMAGAIVALAVGAMIYRKRSKPEMN